MVDLPGFGKSEPPPAILTMEAAAAAVVALLDHLEIASATVAGLSMGGYVSFALHRMARERIRRLVLCDTKAADDDEAARTNRERFAQDALEHGGRWVAEQMVDKLLAPAAPVHPPTEGGGGSSARTCRPQ